MTRPVGSAPADPALCLLRGEGPLPGPQDRSWEAVARDLVAEGLAGTALTLLGASHPPDLLPAAARATLAAELGRVRVAQALLFHRFEALAALLRSGGFEFIVHKGGALAPLVYPRLEDRPMVDIDILIRPEDWPRAREALVAAGYRLPEEALQAFWLENYFNLSIRSPEDPASHFDLHWSLTQEGRYHVDIHEIFSRAVPYRLGDASLLRLGNEDLLLSLFLHLAYHYFHAHLIWLYDMARVVDRLAIDWDLLVERARRWGLTAVVGFNVAFLDKTFPGLVPRDTARRVLPGPWRRTLAAPWLSPRARHLFRAEESRFNQFAIGLLAIDHPLDAARFAAGKVSRSLRWLGRRPSRR